MKIPGIQKMTLLDYPGKVACTVFLGGCNFRCPYCHNSELLSGEIEGVMEREALVQLLQKRRGLLDAVCISGGEPTLQPELEDLVRQIKAMGYLVKLDTNGSRPEVLRCLVEAGLVDYVAMDIKNAPQRYSETAGAEVNLSAIEESILFLLQGAVDYEFRTTVAEQLHTREDIAAIGAWLKNLSPAQKAKRYFLQPFVDRETVCFAGLSAPSGAELEAFCAVLSPDVECVTVRGQ